MVKTVLPSIVFRRCLTLVAVYHYHGINMQMEDQFSFVRKTADPSGFKDVKKEFMCNISTFLVVHILL